MALNPACHYNGYASIPDGTLRFCEFAVLNKSNTHETRVHHVETPGRIVSGDSDVGPVWISELQLAVNNGDALSGSQMPDSVNRPVVYSIAFLATTDEDHRKRARDFFKFMLGDAQQIYTDGGFLPLKGTESAERYSFDRDGNFVIESFSPQKPLVVWVAAPVRRYGRALLLARI